MLGVDTVATELGWIGGEDIYVNGEGEDEYPYCGVGNES